MPYLRLILLALASSFLFTSCLGLDVKIIFTDFTAGRVEANYTIPSQISGLRDENLRLLVSLPRDRAGWEAVVAQIPGSGLVSYSQTSSADSQSFQVVLSFATARSLESLFSVHRQKLTLLSNNGVFTLTQAFEGFNPSVWDPATLGLFKSLYASLPLNLEVRAPRPITTNSAGVLSNGRQTARLALTWSDFLKNPPPGEWKLVW